jgi:hypothetical protein
LQYAFEEERVTGLGVNSIFTEVIVEGLKTGAADTNSDGYVTLDELFAYAEERVLERTPTQRPMKWSLGATGRILIAHNKNQVATPDELPAKRPQPAELTWTDPATGLMWATKDNGRNVTWQQAMDYARDLRLAGYSDWRLPTIGELEGIHDPSADVNGYHVKGNPQLSGWEWTTSPGDAAGEAWAFGFVDGERSSCRFGYSGGFNALCVRRSGATLPASNPTGAATPDQGNTQQMRGPRNAPEEAAEVWTDPATGLMWAKKDNGSDATWQQAMDYAQNLRLAGYSDWRLPTIEELHGIYNPGAHRNARGNLQLSAWWQWSSSQGNAPGGAWAFSFNDGGRLFHPRSAAGRALCVRRSGD